MTGLSDDKHGRMTTLGLVTIGQSPRQELADEVAAVLPRHVKIVQAGALDGLTGEQLDRLQPEDDGTELTTVLKDGREVRVDMQLLVPLVEAAISTVEQAGAAVTLFACTGSFPVLAHRAPLLHAERLLSNGVAALASHMSTVGVVAPLVEQVGAVRVHWRDVLGERVWADSANPYVANPLPGIASVAKRLANHGAELLVLDCMGFGEAARAAAATSGVPVVLARTLVGRFAAELVCGLARPPVTAGAQPAAISQRFPSHPRSR